MTRDEALAIVKEYTKNDRLIKHMLAVEAAMRAFARRYGEDEEKWGICGLLHDFDYEKMGEEHPSEWGFQLLEERGVDSDIIQAIRGHALRDDPSSRPTKMAKALFAVDELTGFIVAVALVRPNQISDLKVKSVKKRFKDKSFAKGVNRDDIFNGAKELGVELDDLIQTTIDAMKEIKSSLDLK